MLKLDTAVHRDEGIVVATQAPEELAVLDAGPAATDHGVDVVAVELRREVYRQLLVKKAAHRPRSPASVTR